MRIGKFCQHSGHLRAGVLVCRIVHVLAVFQQRGTQVNLFSVDYLNDPSVCTIFCDRDLHNRVRRTVFVYLCLSMPQLRLMQYDTGFVRVVL